MKSCQNQYEYGKYFFHDEILFGILQNHFPGVVQYWEILPKYSSEIKFEYQNHPQIMILHTKIYFPITKYYVSLMKYILANHSKSSKTPKTSIFVPSMQLLQCGKYQVLNTDQHQSTQSSHHVF